MQTTSALWVAEEPVVHVVEVCCSTLGPKKRFFLITVGEGVDTRRGVLMLLKLLLLLNVSGRMMMLHVKQGKTGVGMLFTGGFRGGPPSIFTKRRWLVHLVNWRIKRFCTNWSGDPFYVFGRFIYHFTRNMDYVPDLHGIFCDQMLKCLGKLWTIELIFHLLHSLFAVLNGRLFVSSGSRLFNGEFKWRTSHLLAFYPPHPESPFCCCSSLNGGWLRWCSWVTCNLSNCGGWILWLLLSLEYT